MTTKSKCRSILMQTLDVTNITTSVWFLIINHKIEEIIDYGITAYLFLFTATYLILLYTVDFLSRLQGLMLIPAGMRSIEIIFKGFVEW